MSMPYCKHTYPLIASTLTVFTGKVAYMLKDRIRSSRITAHLTQQALADLVGVKRGAVAQWETGASKTLEAENLLAAAKAMDVSAYWLATGKGDKRRNVLHNVTLGPDTRGFVPLISWVQAGSWDEAIANAHNFTIIINH